MHSRELRTQPYGDLVLSDSVGEAGAELTDRGWLLRKSLSRRGSEGGPVWWKSGIMTLNVEM